MAAPGQARPVRVLIVDDSVIARQMVAREIVAQPAMLVAGLASNGQIALDRLDDVRPDIVVLDLEMPVMDGFDTLREIRRRRPELPVVIFSNLTRRGAQATLEAMALGATAYALKPSTGSAGRNTVREELIPLLVALTSQSRGSDPTVGKPRSRASRGVDAVVIGVSTGGPDALTTVLSGLPGDLGVPILIVQHMPALFTALLAKRLDQASALAVWHAEPDQLVMPSTVYIAQGGRHLALGGVAPNARIVVHDGPRENSCRPAADVLFRSAAAAYGSGVLGVVLTGMGRDGLRGSEYIVEAGGAVIAQDPLTAVVSSMPGAVIAAGLADQVVALDQISAAICARVKSVGQ